MAGYKTGRVLDGAPRVAARPSGEKLEAEVAQRLRAPRLSEETNGVCSGGRSRPESSAPALIGLPVGRLGGTPVPSVTALSPSMRPAPAITPSYMFSYGNGWGGGGVAAVAVAAPCEKAILALHSSVPVMLRTDAN